MAQIIQHLRLRDSLRTANGEERFLRNLDGYNMQLHTEPQLVKVLHVRSGNTYFIPLSNVVWFELDAEQNTTPAPRAATKKAATE